MQYEQEMFTPFLNKKVIANFTIDNQERKAIGFLTTIFKDKIYIKGTHREWLLGMESIKNINTLD